MIVCIAEKPSVARDIANILGAQQPKGGYYEGNGYQVTWTFGHLCTLKEPHEYSLDWKAWNINSLPMIPPRFSIRLIEQKSIEKQFSVIEYLMQHAEMIVNCGDAGQEGELIQRWVMQKANPTCPIKRLWISSLTEESIREGFENLKDEKEFQPLYEAGLARAIGDWLLGMNATRLYTLKYAENKQVLSVGRVQTPTLALIVNRQDEIDNFVPVPYWELKTVYRETTFNAATGKFDNPEEAQEQLKIIDGKPFTIIGIQNKKGSEFPPRLFDLTSLQVECNKKFGFSADETLKLIQGLYERKLTTYPRVDTTFLSDDIYSKCPSILKGLRDYALLTAPLLSKKLTKSKKVFNNTKVTDHHAIIPTGVYPSGLVDNEKKVYNLITRRFIAAFYPACEFSTTTVEGEVEKFKFKTTGKQILDKGWRVVFENDADEGEKDQEKEEGVLPSFTKGESGPHEPSLQEKATTPPKLYTEATLLRAMETAGKFVETEELSDALKVNGIGRPSTRAAIIETLFKRDYIKKERKNLVPTQTGKDLIRIIHEEILKSVELTGMWEKKLREIENQTYNAAHFIEELKDMVSEIVQSVKNDYTDRRQVLKEGDPCPMCGRGVLIRGNTAFGCSRWKEDCTFRGPL